jgi:hypothetical protein
VVIPNLRKTRAIHLHAIQPDTPDIRSCAFPIISLPISRAIMLLALLPRKADDTTLMEGFKARFTGKTK